MSPQVDKTAVLLLCVVLTLPACDATLATDAGSELEDPAFARGGIPGPPGNVELPRVIGPPPRVPVPLPPRAGPPVFLTNAIAVGAGWKFSCALRSDGAVFCWGLNNKGQLGDGTQIASAVPVRVSGELNFNRLFVGDDRACGTTAEGNSYCWGGNDNGQLGAGPSIGPNSSVPILVTGGHRFNHLSVGLRSTCGVAADGITYCWGNNLGGQLEVGLPIGQGTDTPLPVASSASLGLVTVNNGFVTTCGLDGDGAVFCWGRDQGDFGNGSADVFMSSTPASAAFGMTFSTIEVGSRHACGLDHGGRAHCWGNRNLMGEQGIGSTTPTFRPTAVAGELVFVSLDTDDTNLSLKSVCGVTVSNQAWCWGDNEFGKLGGPSTERCLSGTVERDCSTTPIAVSGGIKFASVVVGADHACGLAEDGSIFCWGGNGFGELGDGTMRNSQVPVPVRGLIGG